MKLPVRRIIAWCIDWVCILGWVAVTAAAGIPLYANGLIHLNDTAQENIVGAAVIVVPIVVAAAVCESRSKPSTPGKRMMHLQVRTGSARPDFLRALARNSLKLGVALADRAHGRICDLLRHSRRHDSNSGLGSHRCGLCDPFDLRCRSFRR